jgi:hypothetical protein
VIPVSVTVFPLGLSRCGGTGVSTGAGASSLNFSFRLVASIRGVAAAASVVFVEFRFGAPFGVISVVDDSAFEGRLGWTATAASLAA